MESANTEFMKIGVRGVSILFASGDQGVCGREGCGGKRFHPDFPAGSPCVLREREREREGERNLPCRGVSACLRVSVFLNVFGVSMHVSERKRHRKRDEPALPPCHLCVSLCEIDREINPPCPSCCLCVPLCEIDREMIPPCPPVVYVCLCVK